MHFYLHQVYHTTWYQPFLDVEVEGDDIANIKQNTVIFHMKLKNFLQLLVKLYARNT